MGYIGDPGLEPAGEDSGAGGRPGRGPRGGGDGERGEHHPRHGAGRHLRASAQPGA